MPTIVRFLLLLMLMPMLAVAQDRFPSKPITIIVPYGPGGAADIVLRPLTTVVSRELGQSTIVVNRAGASGAIGTRSVTTAPPDGYTLLAGAVQMSVLPEVDALSGRTPSYRRDQLVGIARLTADPVVFLVPATSPWNSMKDVIDAARAKPRSVSYSTGGNYSGIHLAFELLLQKAQVSMLSVPYQGGGPAMSGMLSGDVQMTAQVPSVAAPHVASGRMKALAHSGVRKLAEFPGVPSLKDLGYDVEFYLWVGLFAPKDTPAGTVAALRGAVGKAMKSDEMHKFAATTGTVLAYQDADEFNAWWAQDAAKLTEAVRKMGKIE